MESAEGHPLRDTNATRRTLTYLANRLAVLTKKIGLHGMTPAEYRERYNLKADYPMVASGYSECRRAMAKRIDLDRKPGQASTAKAGAAQPAPRKRNADDAGE